MILEKSENGEDPRGSARVVGENWLDLGRSSAWGWHVSNYLGFRKSNLDKIWPSSFCLWYIDSSLNEIRFFQGIT